MSESIKFDSTEIRTTDYTPRFVKHESAPESILQTLQLARDDGDILINTRYGKKIIKLQGILTGTSSDDLESKIDAFKELFSRKEKNLDINWNGGTRRYVASVTAHDFDRDHFNLNFVPWTAEFTVLSGEGKDTSATVAVNANSLNTSPDAYIADTIVFAGSKAPKPVITLQGNNFVTAQGIEYMNDDTKERLVVTGATGQFGATDSIVIDCNARKVTKNGAEVKFFGVFPTFKIGTNNVKIKVGDLINQDNITGQSPTFASFIQGGSAYLAQSFMVPNADASFQGLTVRVGYVGTPGGILVEICSDNNGVPGTQISDSLLFDTTSGVGTFDASGNFTTPVTLQANTKYWVRMRSTGTTNSSNYFKWWGTQNASYVRGTAAHSSDAGSTWGVDLTQDYCFKVLYGGHWDYTGAERVLHTVSYTKTYL